MSFADIIEELKEKVSLPEIITALKVGEFSNMNNVGSFRGVHGTHPSTSKDHCEVSPRQGTWRCYSCGESGSVIDWVLSVKFGGKQSCFVDAVKFLADYAGLDSSDTPLDSPRYQAYRLLTDLSHTWNQSLLEDKKILKWVKDQWGLTKTTVEKLCIGYVEDMPEGIPSSDLLSAGLVNDAGKFMLYRRIVFPHFKGGRVQWIAGRYYGDPPDGKLKYASLWGTSYVHRVLYNYDNALYMDYDQPLLITEGLADAAMAVQAGLRVCALGSATVPRECLNDLRRLGKEADTKYLILDSEDSGAGLKGAMSTARSMIFMGYDPLIVQLPRGDRAKLDLADYLRDNSSETLGKILREGWTDRGIEYVPESLAEIEIRECPERPEADRLMTVLQSFAPLADVLANKYIESLSKKTKAAPGDLKKMLATARKKLEPKHDLQFDEKWQPPTYMAQDATYHPDIDIWRMHTTVYVPCIRTVIKNGEEYHESIMAPLYVATDMTATNQYAITACDKIENPSKELMKLLPSEGVINSAQTKDYAWSFTADFPYSVKNFIEGKTGEIDVSDLYQRVFNLYDRYVYYPDPRDKHILALFTFFTYIYMGFDATPYLHCNGVKNSGKSTTLNILAKTCFNTVAAVSISEASGFRIIDANRSTLIIDEAERMRHAKQGSNDAALRDMAQGGYQKSSQAKSYRCRMEDLQPIDFFVYCPKVFGSIQTLGDVLGSRVITIQCRTARREDLSGVRDLTQDNVYLKREYQEIRDRLHVWAMTRFRGVRERYDSFTRDKYPFLGNRSRELWLPLFALAEEIGEAAGVKLSEVLTEVAIDKLQIAEVAEINHDFTAQVLRSLYSVLKDNPDSLQLKTVKDQVWMPTSVAVEQVRTRLIREELWDDKRNNLTAATFNKMLRDTQCVPPKARAMSYRSGYNNERMTHLPFVEPALEEFLQTRGLLDVEGNTVEIQDVME